MKFAYFTAIISFVYLTASCNTRINKLSGNIAKKQMFVKQINTTVKFTGNDATAAANELQGIVRSLDKEWQINKTKIAGENIPSAIMDKYLSMNNNSWNQEDTIVRCSFNTETRKAGIFEFKLGGIDTAEIIVNAELYIYSGGEEIIENNSSGPVTMRLYQIIATENQNISSLNPDLHNLLTVAYLPYIKPGWQVFNVKPAVENWLKSDPNLGILLVTTDTLGNRILYPNFASDYLNTGPQRTFLLMVFTKTRTTVNWPSINTKANDAREDEYDEDNDDRCARKVWNINFDDFGWNFIIKPKTLAAYQCSGNCLQISHSLFNYYGLLLNFYKKRNYGKKYSVSCCVPVIFSSTTIMFYDNFDNIVIKSYHDMIVEQCGCR